MPLRNDVGKTSLARDVLALDADWLSVGICCLLDLV